MPTAEAPLSSRAMLKQGGWSRGEGRSRGSNAAGFFSPLLSLSSTAWLPSWPWAERRPRSRGGGGWGQHQGKGPSAQGGGKGPPPTTPHLIHSTEKHL